MEDLAVIFTAFAASTIIGVAYAASKRMKKTAHPPVVKQVVVLQAGDLPEQVDTRFSRLVLEAEERVRAVEEKALKLLEDDEDERQA
ncbi:MAG: hypothetical protein NZ941_06865 [Candidatus Caldarchaeum sp.]|nr:hypothetical protein [Candidatus Caldarchaeum sp.]MDW7978668.1 hypothetical protein [Candidatus Caldarchaeum sp.]